MKKRTKIVVSILLFAAICAGAHFALQHAFMRFMIANEDRFRRDYEFSQLEPKPTILICGDSHAFLGLMADEIGDAYNLAYLGEGFAVTYYKLKRLFEQNPGEFKTVLVSVGFHSFFTDIGYEVDDFYRGEYVNYFELGRQRGQVPEHIRAYARYRLFRYADAPGNLYEYVEEERVVRELRKRERRTRVFANAPDREEQARARAKVHYSHFNTKSYYRQENVDYLYRLIDLCDQHQVTPVVVMFPVTSLYYQEAKAWVDTQHHRRILADIQVKRPRMVLLDHHDTFFDRDDLFIDADHMNFAGAHLFSAIIREELIEHGVSVQRPGAAESMRAVRSPQAVPPAVN